MKNDQQYNLTEFARFLTKRTPVSHFLLLTIFFSVLIVVFGDPSDILSFTTQNTKMAAQVQVAITSAAGLAMLVISRIVLMAISGSLRPSAIGCIIWLLTEIIAIIAVLSLTLWLVSGTGRLELATLAGDFLLALLAVEALPYLVSFLAFRLKEAQDEVRHLQSKLFDAQAILGFSDANDPRILNFYDRGNKLAFSTSCANILYIEAADNYVNIHYLNEGHEDTFILHNTLKEMDARLKDTPMIRCHRSYIVNLENVKLLRKEGPALLLELEGTNKTVPVTKTYSGTITERIAPALNTIYKI